jgi:hypothetical protein
MAEELGDVLLSAEALQGVASAWSRGDAARAARLLGAANALLESVGGTADESALGAVRAAMDDDVFEREFAEGRKMARDDVLLLALAS